MSYPLVKKDVDVHPVIRDGHSFFLWNKIFKKERTFSWKKKRLRNKLDRSEKWKNYRFWKRNEEKAKTNDLKSFKQTWKRSFFYWINVFFWDNLLNKRFFRTRWNFFTKRTILLNRRFDWTIVQRENEQNRWKLAHFYLWSSILLK